ncbi:MAG: NAD(P)H-dependent oxidoreductase subunit E [Ectothiorhodospiraceae bacterium]|nr:NAD(P)H-dependent oxidoreductase subunit E [Ectothiorhodospiraceae bacterium]
MRLLKAMLALQASEGAVTDAALRKLARAENVPLYRLQGLRSFYPVFREQPGRPVQVQGCRDLVCRMAAGGAPADAVRDVLAGRGDAEITEVSCLGQCDHAPAAMVDNHPVCGGPRALQQYLAGEPAPSPVQSDSLEHWPTDPYDSAGQHYATARSLLAGGDPESVIAALKQAGLRGLGGAAFPTGMKWEFTRKAEGAEKYVICNADESEPGTFKDRVILEDLPHLVIEGMLLGAWVIGARRGIIYLRHEYHAAEQALGTAIAAARRAGALGRSVFGGDFAFDLEVFVSPGGYIMGEETALLEALEDQRGEPRNKPPFPTNAGLNGRPTLINNVETFSAVTTIAARGADWWNAQGIDDHAGLKFVSVSGDVARPGVHCVPWGTTARDVLKRCGGMAEGRALKAFSPGGASTAFLPPDKLDTPLDFDTMQAAGSALGTGAMVFVAEHRDLLDVTLAQVRFFRNESCGKCVPCRVGSRKAVELVEQVQRGESPRPGVSLAALHATLAKTSICGLGQVALLPLVDALATFPDEPSLQALREEEP